MKRRLALGVAVSLVVASCGLDVGEARVGPTPSCDTTSRGMLILMAQALPDAAYVPCFLSMPDGWTLEGAEIETGDVELSVDRAGVGDVEITLTPTCAPDGEPVSLDLPEDVETFETGEIDIRRWLVFDGGCVTIESLGDLDLSTMVEQVSLMSRTDLRELSGLTL